MKRRTQGRCLFGAILLLASLVAGSSLAQAGFRKSYGGRGWDELLDVAVKEITW